VVRAVGTHYQTGEKAPYLFSIPASLPYLLHLLHLRRDPCNCSFLIRDTAQENRISPPNSKKEKNFERELTLREKRKRAQGEGRRKRDNSEKWREDSEKRRRDDSEKISRRFQEEKRRRREKKRGRDDFEMRRDESEKRREEKRRFWDEKRREEKRKTFLARPSTGKNSVFCERVNQANIIKLL
jgi:hypothetical protein